MKVGIFSTHAFWPTHFETELELIQIHLDKKDKVIQFYCNQNFISCDVIFEISGCNRKKYDEIKNKTCEICLKRQKVGTKLIKGSLERHELIQANFISVVPSDDYFESQDSFKKLYIEDYEVGWSLLSSLISNTVDPFVDVNIYKNDLINGYQDCYNIYYNTISLISKYKLDKVYVFNGRFSHTRAIFRASKKLNIECIIHERGSSINKYSLSYNHLPHDIAHFGNNVANFWKSEPSLEKKEKYAAQFFNDRRNGKIGSWISFNEKQKKGSIPIQFQEEGKKIVLFTSSEDEFASIDESWNNPFFSKQIEGIQFICDALQSDQLRDYKLFIRMHPNSVRLGDIYLSKIYNLDNNENIIIIKPDSTTDTYALLDVADVVLTFGSTIGFEAVYNNKYVIEIGKSIYSNLNGPIRPLAMKDLVDLIVKPTSAVDKSDAIKLGYYLKNFGTDYKYYKPSTYMFGTFKGKDLNKLQCNRPPLYKSLFRKIKNRVRKILN